MRVKPIQELIAYVLIAMVAGTSVAVAQQPAVTSSDPASTVPTQALTQITTETAETSPVLQQLIEQCKYPDNSAH